jgi:hypothetical protein
MPIKIVEKSITANELKDLARERFGDMVKVVVDVEKRIAAFGAELHADEEAILLEQGSKQENLWGVNIYVNEPKEDWIEYNSMINLRPSQNNFSRGVEDPNIQSVIKDILNDLIQ